MTGALQWFALTLARSARILARRRGRSALALDRFIDQELEPGVACADRWRSSASAGHHARLHAGLRRGRRPRRVVPIRAAGGARTSARDELAAAVLLVHGEADDLIPVEALHLAREALAARCSRVEWHVRAALRTASMPRADALAAHFLAQALHGLRPAPIAQFCLSFQAAAGAFTGPTCTASMAPLIEPGGVDSRSRGYGREIGAVNAYTAAPENFPGPRSSMPTSAP
jgi:hypothetical protein